MKDITEKKVKTAMKTVRIFIRQRYMSAGMQCHTIHKSKIKIFRNDKTAISIYVTFSMQMALLCCSWLTNSLGVFLMSRALRIDAI